MSTSPPTPPATITYPPVPAVSSSPQADVRPANASTAIVNHFLSSLPAVWKFSTTVYCELLQIILLATLALVMGNLFWHSVLLDAIVIMSAIGILFTGYCKLQTKNDDSGTAEPKKYSLWIKLTGNRLLNIVPILVFGVLELVESINNQTMIVTIAGFIGAVIAVITTVIGYFEQDHPTVAGWFFRTDYGWFILLVLNKLWNICAYVFVALLLLPLGTIGMINPSTYALGHGTATALGWDWIIDPFPVAMVGARILSSVHTIDRLKLVEKLWNVMFFWGVLWMTLLIWIRSNPEVERQLAGIYMRFPPGLIVLTYATGISLHAVVSLFSFYRSRRRVRANS